MCASPIKLVTLARTATENNKWRLKRKNKHISILKSFIVLQKSNYYLTRKKDKWQIIYITNARPAHIVPPVSNGIQKTNPHLVFRLLAKTSQDESEVDCCRFCCDLRLENGTLRYIHSQCLFLPSLSCRLQHRLTVNHGQGRFTLEQKWSIPLEQGFLSIFSPKLCGFILTLLYWLIKHTGVGYSTEMTEEMLPGLVRIPPLWMMHTQF